MAELAEVIETATGTGYCASSPQGEEKLYVIVARHPARVIPRHRHSSYVGENQPALMLYACVGHACTAAPQFQEATAVIIIALPALQYRMTHLPKQRALSLTVQRQCISLCERVSPIRLAKGKHRWVEAHIDHLGKYVHRIQSNSVQKALDGHETGNVCPNAISASQGGGVWKRRTIWRQNKLQHNLRR